MAATGTQATGLDFCERGAAFEHATSCDGHTKVTFPHTDCTWFLPRELLRLSFGYTWSKAKLEDEITLKYHGGAVVFGTFIQRLYTTKYTEKEGQVKALHTCLITDSGMATEEVASSATMDWSVKAAILAWGLGREMKAPESQNHVMTRLFAALSRDHERPQLTPKILRYVILRQAGLKVQPLRYALEDLIIRNWATSLSSIMGPKRLEIVDT